MGCNTESGPERRSYQTASGRRSNQGKMIEADLNRPGSRPLVYHYIYGKILHRRIQILLNYVGKPVYLIYKKYISLFQTRQQTREVTRLVQNRSGGYFHIYAQLIGHYMGQSGLSESRRSMQQNMIESFPAQQGSLDENLQIFNNFVLTGEIFEVLWPDFSLKIAIFGHTLSSCIEFFVTHTL